MKRPITLTLAITLLTLLSLLVGGLALANQFNLLPGATTGMFGLSARAGLRQSGGQMPEGAAPNFQRPDGETGPRFQRPEGANPNRQPGQGGGQVITSIGGQTLGGMFTLLRYLQLGLNLGLALFGLLAAVLAWQRKRAGLVLGVIVAGVLLLLQLPGLALLPRLITLSNRLNTSLPNLPMQAAGGLWWSLWPSAAALLLALLSVIFLLLPATRQAFATAAVLDEDDEDDEDDEGEDQDENNEESA